MRFTPKQVKWRADKARELAHKEYKAEIAKLEASVKGLEEGVSKSFVLGFSLSAFIGTCIVILQYSYFTNGMIWRFLSAQ